MLKQVPDTETVIKIGPNGKSIATSDSKWAINPYDPRSRPAGKLKPGPHKEGAGGFAERVIFSKILAA